MIAPQILEPCYPRLGAYKVICSQLEIDRLINGDDEDEMMTSKVF